MNRTFVIGDIHGAYHALRQCMDRALFDYEDDTLICLGDVCDGWPHTNACIGDLLKVKNLIYVLGNHDWWTLEWMTSGYKDSTWFSQGGEATVNSYPEGVPESHKALLRNAQTYYILKNKLFVHAGFDPNRPIEMQGIQVFLWDRHLARTAFDFYQKHVDGNLTMYDEVYLGHTPIPYKHPIKACDIWLMDTGAGWSGVLSIMNIDTKEIFTSDEVPTLYPGVKGRSRNK